jgi:hypothetical protein
MSHSQELKMKIKELTEADKPTDVKDKEELDWETMFDEPASKGELSTNRKTTATDKAASPKASPKLKVGSRADVAKKTAGMQMTPDMAHMLGGLNIPDDQLEPPEQALVPHEPVTSANVPATISREIEMSDPSMVSPTFLRVADLPGNMNRAILTMGKALFRGFTKTPTKDIVMIGNMGGMGPNSQKEVRSVAKWVVDNGEDVDTAHMDFGPTMPGYEADVKQFSTAGVRFMLVRDQFGDYIYAWPEADSVSGTQKLSSKDAGPKRLR